MSEYKFTREHFDHALLVDHALVYVLRHSEGERGCEICEDFIEVLTWHDLKANQIFTDPSAELTCECGSRILMQYPEGWTGVMFTWGDYGMGEVT